MAIGLVLAISSSTYRRDRLFTFLHPTQNCQSTGTGYQACQAIIAVGSGGIVGKGLARGVQDYGYLPESDNDSIFAVYAEQFGFIGSVVLVCLFMALFLRIKKYYGKSTQQLYEVDCGRGLSVACRADTYKYRRNDWTITPKRYNITPNKLRRYEYCLRNDSYWVSIQYFALYNCKSNMKRRRKQ